MNKNPEESLNEHKSDIKTNKVNSALLSENKLHKANICELLGKIMKNNHICNDYAHFFMQSAWIDFIKTVITFK